MEAKARELCFTLAELVGGTGNAGKKGKAPRPAKYRHTKNASLSGSGRQPGWIKEALAKDTSLDALLIETKSSS